MEGVSGIQKCSLPFEAPNALHARVYVDCNWLHLFEQEALFALPLGVDSPNHTGLFCALSSVLSM